jgi:inhibitor of KinA sporulation pathway (predicted exonuclease)
VNTVIVVDLEATCWFPRNTNRGQKPEIIEIGAAKLEMEWDGSYIVTPLDPNYVAPEESTISDFCTELTGLTQAHLDKYGVPLEPAVRQLESYCQGPGYLRSWASYGSGDRDFLKAQCERFNMRYPMSEVHFDIQALMMLMRGCRRIGLRNALDRFGLTFEGKPHRGIDDAVNAARVLGEMVKRYRIKEIK